jgi:hypothetical protein
VVLEDCVVERAAGEGVFVAEGCKPELRGMKVSGTRGRGMHFAGRCGGTVSGCTVSDVDGIGVAVTERSVTEFDQITVSKCTQAGVRVDDGSDPLFRRLRVLGCDGDSIELAGSARGTLENVEIEGGSTGLAVSEAARPTVNGLSVRGTAGAGVSVAGAALALAEGAIDGAGGDGVHAGSGADLSLVRCRVQGSGGMGCLFAEGASGSVTESEFSGGSADGIRIDTEESVRVAGCTVRDNHGSGVRQTRPGTAIEVLDLITSGNLAPDAFGTSATADVPAPAPTDAPPGTASSRLGSVAGAAEPRRARRGEGRGDLADQPEQDGETTDRRRTVRPADGTAPGLRGRAGHGQDHGRQAVRGDPRRAWRAAQRTSGRGRQG